MLAVWEQGYGQSAVVRMCLLLQAILPQTSVDVLNQMPLGRRNKLLLAFRVHRFGPRFEAVSRCRECRRQVDLTFDIGAMQGWNTDISEGDTEREFLMTCDNIHIHYRLPTTGDILSLSGLSDPSHCREVLLNRCIVSAERDGTNVSSATLPEDVLRDISERLDRSDPLAAIHLKMDCPHCLYQWEAPFDIAGFLSSEIDSWAKRLLMEIHILAKTYHWSESDILTMGAWRRRIYLALVEG